MALSVPFQASGVFVLDYNDELLLPFEGTGVASQWVFEMPKAANRFDFRSVADILMTIEYTALDSREYGRQVLRTMDPRFVLERAFSFRQNFADAWYDLNHPRLQAPEEQMVVSFETNRGDFAPNAESLSIQHVTLLFVRREGDAREMSVEHLHFSVAGSGTVGGAAETVGGFFSTRTADSHPWSDMRGRNPVGNWELKLPNDDETKQRIASGEISDILVVISYEGTSPGWPT